MRAMGRAAAGVRGIRLGGGDVVVEAAVVSNAAKSDILVVMENGLGKATPVTEYRFQGRGGSGVKAAQITAKTGDIVGGAVLTPGEDGDLLLLSKKGQAIRMKLSAIPSQGRATQGVIVMRLDKGDKVASMSVVMDEGAEESAMASEESLLEDIEAAEEEQKKIERAEKKSKKSATAAAKAPSKKKKR